MIRRLLALALLAPSLAWADTYFNTVTADTPCHWYRMDATSGSTEPDARSGCSGSSAINLTYAGGFTLSQTGILNSQTPNLAVKFDGTSGTKAEGVPDSDCLPKTGNNVGWSMEAWFKSTGGDSVAVSAYSTFSGPTNYSYYVNYNPSGSGQLAFEMKQGDCSSDHGFPQVGSSLNDGNYHQVVITTLGNGSGDIQHVKIYIDASLLITFTAFTGSTICTGVGHFGLAQISNVGRFVGTEDEVSFYRAELSSTQVTTHRNAALTAPTVLHHRFFQIKAPELPRFLDGEYFQKMARNGYVDGFWNVAAMSRSALLRTGLNVGFLPNFVVVPDGRGN